MLEDVTFSVSDPLQQAIIHAYRMDETQAVQRLLEYVSFTPDQQQRIKRRAETLVQGVRLARKEKGGIDAFMTEYDLSTQEGIALMCVAEAMLRIPDKATVDSLIEDKIATANWQAHRGQSDSIFVNAATWSLMLTGKVLNAAREGEQIFSRSLKSLAKKTGKPFIRSMVGQAMKILGEQFVMGSTIKEALKRAKSSEKKGYRYSYDMLGEAARTEEDAQRYLGSYMQAIEAIGNAAKPGEVYTNPGVSVKLSALHPRYEFAQRERVLSELAPRLLSLAEHAKSFDIGLTVDAEESERLDISLEIMDRVMKSPSLNGWNGFGLAVQSYQKRGFYVLDWLSSRARHYGRRLNVRLIKGAYWDSEIKRTQELGLSNYPVFTRKLNTDVSFLACAKKILTMTDVIYPQFATHNAHTVSAILELAGEYKDFEFQCLHGMGQTLYDQMLSINAQQSRNLKATGYPCRIYAPVGAHQDLLPYLVRRLLENGANSSFVNRIIDDSLPIDEIIACPLERVRRFTSIPHPKIPLPLAIYANANPNANANANYRTNSCGLDLTHAQERETLQKKSFFTEEKVWQAIPIIGKNFQQTPEHQPRNVVNPANLQQIVGSVLGSREADVELALNLAEQAVFGWRNTKVTERAQCLEKMGELLETNREIFYYLAVHEAGKTMPDAIAEVREAIDFCYYYAHQARHVLANPLTLPGPTGEENRLELHGRGIAVCISPWNFPLAIFLGQIAAALVAGNVVIAKPAEQTPLIAFETARLLHAAGIPQDVLIFLPGRGSVVGARLCTDPRVQIVLFTGSTETARLINRNLASRDSSIATFIAETGGQNIMLVDSSALLEQAVVDVMASAFGSAGQRCSALRVLFLQEEIADKFIYMLKGAMAELRIGLPGLLQTDIGPVIDKDALAMLAQHVARMEKEAQMIYQVPLSATAKNGHFFAPVAFEIQSLQQLPQEIFGPVLHIIRYKAKNLDQVIADVNATGYGLTLGIQSRVNSSIDYIQQHMRVGNIYVNRNMIGAVVGVQPFGGEGLSGTGPKAGGPHYLLRLCNEQTVTINTTAAGGNASLMSLGESE